MDGERNMKILFYDTKEYDQEYFETYLPDYPEIEIKFIKNRIRHTDCIFGKWI